MNDDRRFSTAAGVPVGDAAPHIEQLHVSNCTLADPAYGSGVAAALGLMTFVQAAEQSRPEPRQ